MPRRASLPQSEASSDQKIDKYKIQPFWGIADPSLNYHSTSSENHSKGDVHSLSDLFPCFRANEDCIRGMNSIVNSTQWRIIVLIFEALLLFGPPTRDWWCPKRSDGVFDILFIITIVVLFADIVLMSYALPKYFSFYIGCRPHKDTQMRSMQEANDNRRCCGGASICYRFEFGGFIFWFDVISALTLLFDITLINSTLTQYKTRQIYVDPSGQLLSDIVVHGTRFPDFASISGLSRWYFILIALRTPRIARFMQGSGLVWLWLNISEKIESTQCLTRGGTQMEVNHVRATSDASYVKSTSDAPLDSEPDMCQDSSIPQDLDQIRSKEAKKPSKHQPLKKLYKMKNFLQNHNLDQNPRTFKKKANSGPSLQSGLNTDAFDYVNTISFSRSSRTKSSHVGKEMHELTVKRVALGCMIAFIVTALFTNYEKPLYLSLGITTMHSTLFTMKAKYGDQYLPTVFNMIDLNDGWDVYYYRFGNITLLGNAGDDLREREKLRIVVQTCEEAIVDKHTRDYTYENCTTDASVSMINIKSWNHHLAGYTLLSVLFIMCIWYAAVACFAGPITALIIIPIERMIKILNMLVKDPLGYQNSKKYMHFVEECEEIDRYSKWKKENLEGMETTFLMSTILRIGSLMKVGFGKAGAEIIRQSLEKQGPDDTAFLKKRTSDTNVSCIFLFCDIRRFTDTTECLLEEVFVFTNKIAAVVHSICHSYGGSANKNIGDAFLISWLLKERNEKRSKSIDNSTRDHSDKNKEADVALLAVIKIMIALNYESYFLEDLSPERRKRLKLKFSEMRGPLVQMGFGLHAGKAVQGAIGSQRKLDATYISNAVEQAEYLESSTKRYGVQMLMSGTFYSMLSQSIQRRCRKIDQIYFRDDDGDQYEEPNNPDDYEKMELYTHDIDVSHLDFTSSASEHISSDAADSSAGSDAFSSKDYELKKVPLAFGLTNMALTWGSSSNTINGNIRDRDMKSKLGMKDQESKDTKRAIRIWNNLNYPELSDRVINEKIDELVDNRDSSDHIDEVLALPTEQCIYKSSIWLSEDMRIVRGKYAGSDFFQKFNIAMQHYFEGEWGTAKAVFEEVDEELDDGPSKYYLNKMKETNFVVPRGFTGWNEA